MEEVERLVPGTVVGGTGRRVSSRADGAMIHPTGEPMRDVIARTPWLTIVVGWVIASLAFAFYVANFGSYNKTYGALAGPIVFLVWLWISNIMVLLGAEFNAELERGRAIEAGHPKHEEPYVEPRDTRKLEKERA